MADPKYKHLSLGILKGDACVVIRSKNAKREPMACVPGSAGHRLVLEKMIKRFGGCSLID